MFITIKKTTIFFAVISLMTLPFFYMGCSKKLTKSKLEKKTSIMLKKMESSAILLDNELDIIFEIKITNTKDRMKEAVNRITNCKKTLQSADLTVKNYIAFIKSNSVLLKQEKLNHYISVTDLLNQDQAKKRNSIGEYFSAMERWLNYSANNFEELKSGSLAHRKTYNIYLTNVNRAKKKYEMSSLRYHRFVNSYMEKNSDFSNFFSQKYKDLKKGIEWL
jgi:hypothetical protein